MSALAAKCPERAARTYRLGQADCQEEPGVRISGISAGSKRGVWRAKSAASFRNEARAQRPNFNDAFAVVSRNELRRPDRTECSVQRSARDGNWNENVTCLRQSADCQKNRQQRDKAGNPIQRARFSSARRRLDRRTGVRRLPRRDRFPGETSCSCIPRAAPTRAPHGTWREILESVSFFVFGFRGKTLRSSSPPHSRPIPRTVFWTIANGKPFSSVRQISAVSKSRGYAVSE